MIITWLLSSAKVAKIIKKLILEVVFIVFLYYIDENLCEVM